MSTAQDDRKSTADKGVEEAPTVAKGHNLAVLHTPDQDLKGEVIPIGAGITIGRNAASGVDVEINDRLLSRRHATIRPVGTSAICELVDLESSNGSFVEGARVKRSHMAAGTIIRLGVTLFEMTSDSQVELAAEAVDDTKDPFIGRSGTFRAALDQVAAAAQGNDPVVFVGETGTGKKRAAKRLHELTGREGAFVVVHCGSPHSRLTEAKLFGGLEPKDAGDTASDGLIPMAEGGSLLLHEIDLLEPWLQQVVLDLLETGEYTQPGTEETRKIDVQFIASSGANLEAAVDAGAFSQELHEKLASRSIELPALRARRSDIPRLARHFLEVEAPNRTFDWSATCLEKLLLYDWPMNVRELQTVMRRLTLLEDEITTLRSAHLPKEIRKRARQQTEDALRASAITVHSVPSREELARLLDKFGGNVARLAEYYAKDRRHIYRWLSRHDLSVDAFRK